MAQRRKTKAEHDEERIEDQKQAFEEFRRKVESLRSIADAHKLHAEAPPQDSPGHKHYSNFGKFLMAFSPPNSAILNEYSLYLAFIQKMDAAGELPPGARKKIEKDLRGAMAQRPWY